MSTLRIVSNPAVQDVIYFVFDTNVDLDLWVENIDKGHIFKHKGVTVCCYGQYDNALSIPFDVFNTYHFDLSFELKN